MEVDYPAGRPFTGPVGSMMVHEGTVTIPLRLRKTGALADQPRIMVTYQICTDKVCLAPETRPLPVIILSAP